MQRRHARHLVKQVAELERRAAVRQRLALAAGGDGGAEEAEVAARLGSRGQKNREYTWWSV